MIFFDIDGTLLASGKEGYFVPDGTLQAIELAKQNGHGVAICSGRQEPFIRKIFGDFFTSYIAMNGTHVVYEGETILQKFFPPERVLEIMEHFDSFGVSYNFVGMRHGWGRNLTPEMTALLNRVYNLGDYIVTDWEPEQVQAGAVDCIFTDQGHYERCRPAFTGSMVLNLHPGGHSGDLSFPNQDKAEAIRFFCQHTGIELKDTVAFGDGTNDVTMLKTVGVGVAMENGVPEAKAVADYITDSMLCGGIEKGLRHLGLI